MTRIILEEKLNHDISVNIDDKNFGCIYLSRGGAVCKDNEGNPLIILEKSGETFAVKESNEIIGSVYPQNGSYEYKDKDGNVFILEETRRNEFTLKDGKNDKHLIKISFHPLKEISYDTKSSLDSDYY